MASKHDKPAKIAKVGDLIPDDRNANLGTVIGAGLLLGSITELGAGRPVLADKAGRLVAGNKTAEQAAAAGIEDVKVVRTNGRKLVVHQRTDLRLSRDRKAKQLAIADNRIGQVNLAWDMNVLRGLGADLSGVGFTGEELSELDSPEAHTFDGDARPPIDYVHGQIGVFRFRLTRQQYETFLDRMEYATESDDPQKIMDEIERRLGL